jgi:hypothetical protein
MNYKEKCKFYKKTNAVQAYNPSYSECNDKKDNGWRLAQDKVSRTPAEPTSWAW